MRIGFKAEIVFGGGAGLLGATTALALLMEVRQSLMACCGAWVLRDCMG